MRPGEVLGHEAVGVVEAVGAGVRAVRPGDRVVVSFDVACGRCWFCERGQTQLCDDVPRTSAPAPFGGEPRRRAGGARARAARRREPARHPRRRRRRARAVFVGDVLTTGLLRGVARHGGPEDTVAVIGAGPVGFCVHRRPRSARSGPARCSCSTGSAPVCASRPPPARSRSTWGSGAPRCALAAVTGDRGAGRRRSTRSAHPMPTSRRDDLVRRGGRVVVAGMYAGETVELQLGVYWARAIDVRFAGVCPVHGVWRDDGSSLSDAGRLDPLPLVDAPRAAGGSGRSGTSCSTDGRRRRC